MFDKVKQMRELQKMQGEAKAENFQAESRGVRVTVNGTLQIEAVSVPEELAAQEVQEAVKDATNQALKSAQIAMAQKFSGMIG
jgi:DNA-binding protein YbaB